MQAIDWVVLIITLFFIVFYGAWKTRGSKNVQDYILGNNETPWYTVGISVMATQASAITFLSTPGQAFNDGMGFVQFYFGLPLAMIIICITFIPIYHKLKVYTVYEFLEQRFDLKTRSLAAILFLIQRGFSTGITIYAPAIVLSSILGWNLNLMNIIIGILIIIYTMTGGTKAVNVTQKQQMFIIMSGMFIAFFIILSLLPKEVSFNNALQIAGVNDKMNILDFSLDKEKRYTVWTGITGGLFLALSYFGTDQSQAQRYLSGKSVKESQMGLVFNALLKVPMQFFILLVGVMVYVFFQFQSVPINFNPNSKASIEKSVYAGDYKQLENQLVDIAAEKKEVTLAYVNQLNIETDNKVLKNRIIALAEKEKTIREQAKVLISKANKKNKTTDSDYVFIHFIIHYLPKGFVGLLLAVIICAAMSSTAAGINSLASTTVIDIYKRNIKTEKSETHFVRASKGFTLLWGVIAILFACFGTLFENLIQFVNIIGSIFYGTILGIFLVAFYIKYVRAQAVFWAAVFSQIAIFVIYYFAIYIFPPGKEKLSYLWLNFIGVVITIIISVSFQYFKNSKEIKA
ncbi:MULTISPECIES: sodium:solute symporter [Flavobacterium]|jgi:SSS family solute:Na+ symporter|uniref:sodium:solute symporter n=1 Tax=Flavobacterium TaxID=237 RepID=UPI0007006B4A|nr:MULTISPECIES: sodium:solute symporter [Flavobacterium]KQS53435.1 sodium:solute symporter [Flavobacterium sp. Leaf359]MBL7869384.1 sodium:solute symporter [Flavobacterium lindanitolerans]PZO33582.1 MAG: sodium:solute symporter [Flavobacteriaceae bacterium]THD32108.1 MAG: sodium:solute symporter [Flavobacterium johnsoniae]